MPPSMVLFSAERKVHSYTNRKLDIVFTSVAFWTTINFFFFYWVIRSANSNWRTRRSHTETCTILKSVTSIKRMNNSKVYLACAVKAFYNTKRYIVWIPCIIFIVNNTIFFTSNYKDKYLHWISYVHFMLEMTLTKVAITTLCWWNWVLYRK